jgi:outer membrane protein OmpA-like peptidoglycan-associated protein
LIKKGVSSDLITAKGYGESKPIVPNDSDENRKRNRRVEFKITKPNNEVVTTIV